MKTNIKSLLSEGLIKGYGGSNYQKIQRGIFSGESSHFEPNPDWIYHDEWFTENYLGDGQELIKVGEDKYTRLYAGGTPDLEYLQKLGITKKQIAEYLKKSIIEVKDKTRLLEDYNGAIEDDWQYSYKIIFTNPEIPVITAVETITYKNQIVHLHPFILCPIT